MSAAASEAIFAAHVLQALLHKLPRTPAAYERYLVKATTCDHPFMVKDLTWWTTMLAGSYLHKFSELTAVRYSAYAGFRLSAWQGDKR